MPIDLLELECPNCKEMLELDIGFAGGVCRCSNCSILMTVPENPAAERAEKLIRPELPEGSSAEASLDEDFDPAAALADATAIDTGTYTTESGKSVQIDEDTYIPTAQKKARPAVRATVVLVFVLLMASVVGVCAFAMMVLMHGAPEEAWQPGTENIMSSYDSSRNPLKIDQPNLLGLPIGTHAVAVLDTSSVGRYWLGVVKDMILAGTDFEMTGMRFQIVLGSESGPMVFPDQPQPLIELDRGGFKDFLRGVLALGEPDLYTAIDRAITSEPKQIILVTGQQLSDEAVESIAKALDIAPATQFDVMLIDTSKTAAIEDLVNRHKGVCETQTSDQLQQWYNETL